jgi:DNA-binding protein H-NS
MKQIESLKKKAERVRRKERKAVIVDIRAKMHRYGISVRDLNGQHKKKAKTNGAGRKVKAKYRDPASRMTWSGRGRAPRWLVKKEKEGVAREKFLV